MENDWMNRPEGKPLERLLPDGGWTSIFRTIGCVGDSLASGEFEGTDAQGSKTYHDVYEESWGQYMARIAGVRVYNFSRGGMTAKAYMESFADDKGFWNRDLACKAYIVALGADDERAALRDRHREALYRLAERFPNTFVLDFRQYAPVYDKDFYKTFGLGGHLNSMGYLLTARMVVSYIDYIVRSDLPRFARVGCINTPWENEFWQPGER